jgi:hypothetical protein
VTESCCVACGRDDRPRGDQGGVDSKYHRPSSLPWTKKTSATPTARGNLLDNPVEDDVPTTRGHPQRFGSLSTAGGSMVCSLGSLCSVLSWGSIGSGHKPARSVLGQGSQAAAGTLLPSRTQVVKKNWLSPLHPGEWCA